MITIHHRVSAAYRLHAWKCASHLELQPKCIDSRTTEINRLPKRLPCDFLYFRCGRLLICVFAFSLLCLDGILRNRRETSSPRRKSAKIRNSLALTAELRKNSAIRGSLLFRFCHGDWVRFFGHGSVCLPLTFLLMLMICLQMLSKNVNRLFAEVFLRL